MLPTEAFRNSDQWAQDPVTGKNRAELTSRYADGGFSRDGVEFRHSFSGHERNHLFLNQHGKLFRDLSTLSGLDNVADSRSFAVADFDRDGWLDIALVSANRPLFNMYRNRLGDEQSSRHRARRHNMIAIRFIGGNPIPQPSVESSNRDAYGAIVTLNIGTTRIVREHRCGEGFAAQNSTTMLVGIGSHTDVNSLDVRWPSGRTSSTGRIAAGSLVTIYENLDDCPNRRGYVEQPYIKKIRNGIDAAADRANDRARLTAAGWPTDPSEAQRLTMYTTMATWCESCKSHLPQLRQIRASFSGDQLLMYGVPVDPLDGAGELEAYQRAFNPPFDILPGTTTDQRNELQKHARRLVKSDALPATLIVDSSGEVLRGFLGVPNVSQVGKLLFKSRNPDR